MNERNVNGSSGRRTLLTKKTEQTLLDAGFPANRVRYLGSLNGCASALNGSTNPVKAAQTMIDKPGFADGFAAWSKRQGNAANAKRNRPIKRWRNKFAPVPV